MLQKNQSVCPAASTLATLWIGFTLVGGVATFYWRGWEGFNQIGLTSLVVPDYRWNLWLGLLICCVFAAVAAAIVGTLRWLLNNRCGNIPSTDLVLAVWVPLVGALTGLLRLGLRDQNVSLMTALEPLVWGSMAPLLLTTWGAAVCRIPCLRLLKSNPKPGGEANNETPLQNVSLAAYLCLANLAGALVLYTTLFVQTVLGLGSPEQFLLVAGLGGLIGFPLLVHDLMQLFSSTPPSRTTSKQTRWFERVLLAGMLVILTGVVLLAALPPDESDELRYHLAIPKRYLDAGQRTDLPNQSFSHFPLGLDLLFALPLAGEMVGSSADFLAANGQSGDLMGDTCGVRFFHLWFLVLTLLLLRTWSAELGRSDPFSESAAGLAVWGFVTIPFMPVLAGWAFVDLAVAFGWLAGLFCLWRSYQSGSNTQARQALWWCAMAVSWALAVKYTSLAWWVILVVLTVPLVRRDRSAWKPAAGLLILPAVFNLPHWAVNWWTTANPFFPLLSGIFGSGFDPVQKAFYSWHAGMKGALNAWYGLPWWDKLTDLISLPGQVVLWPERFENNPLGGMLLWLLPLAVWGVWQSRRRGMVIGGGALGVYLLWALTYRDPRFAIALWALLALLAGVGWQQLINRQPPANLLRVVMVVAVWWGISQCDSLWLRVAVFRPAIFSQTDSATYLSRRLPYFSALLETEQWRNANLPADQPILLLGQEQSHYFRSPVMGSDYFDGPWLAGLAQSVDTVEALSEAIHSRGVELIWVNRAVLENNAFNLVRTYLFSLPVDQGADLISRLMRTSPTGLTAEDANRLMAQAPESEVFRRIQAWLVRHPGYVEVPLASVPLLNRPVNPFYPEWLGWSELQGVEVTDLPRREFSLLVWDKTRADRLP